MNAIKALIVVCLAMIFYVLVMEIDNRLQGSVPAQAAEITTLHIVNLPPGQKFVDIKALPDSTFQGKFIYRWALTRRARPDEKQETYQLTRLDDTTKVIVIQETSVEAQER